METSRSEYPAILATLNPPQAAVVLQDRLRTISKVNNDVADWLMERRRIEEIYVQGLRKLARKTPPDESSELGIFNTPWQKILGATESMADAHHHLARKIETDVEKPLREFATHSREMQSISTSQGNLQSLAKDYEAAQRKADKGKGKSGKASEDIDTATREWDAQAPFVFETLQAADETRINHLRDVLTQFQTHEVDQVEKNRATAEQCLNSLLVVETADEIKTFAIRTTENAPARKRSERRDSRAQSSSVFSPAIQTISNDEPSVPSVADAGRKGSNATPVQDAEEKKGRFGGLKRLGTVMGRRRSSQTPVKERPTPKKGSSNLGASVMSNGEENETSSHLSGWRAPSPGFTAEPTTTTEEPEEIQARDIPTDGAILDAPSAADTSEPVMSPGIVNGTNLMEDDAQLQQPLQPISTGPPAPIAAPTENVETDLDGFKVPPPALDPISQAEREAASNDENASPLKVDIRNERISEERGDADAAMASMASTLRAQAAPIKRSSTNRGRRDVRSTIIPSSTTPAEVTTAEPPAPQRSFTPPAPQPTFTSPAPPPVMEQPIVATPPPVMDPPIVATPPPATPPLASLPPTQPLHRSSASDDRLGSDAQSIHSTRSLGSTTQMIKHPDMHAAGLNSSIVETVSAWLDHGEVSRGVVIGELALAYNQPDPSNPSLSETIRLENFSLLEKVAPNPTFVKELPTTPGSYTVDVASIPKTSVAFKYQLRLDESTVSKHAPILLTPVWKIEPHQASVILSYTPNPAFSPIAPVTLTNLVLVIYLDPGAAPSSGKPLSCQSKPLGTFSKERSLVYWRIDELALRPGAPPEKILARFATDGEARPGRIEARWEVGGAQADALGSGLSVSVAGGAAAADPFADEDALAAGAWREAKSLRRLVSGTYVAT